MRTILPHGATVVAPSTADRLRIFETARQLGLRYCDAAYNQPNIWNCAPNSGDSIICLVMHKEDAISQVCTPDQFISLMKAQAVYFAVEREQPDTETQLQAIIDRLQVKANIRQTQYMGARQGVTVHIRDNGRTMKLPPSKGFSWGIFKP